MPREESRVNKTDLTFGVVSITVKHRDYKSEFVSQLSYELCMLLLHPKTKRRKITI